MWRTLPSYFLPFYQLKIKTLVFCTILSGYFLDQLETHSDIKIISELLKNKSKNGRSVDFKYILRWKPEYENSALAPSDHGILDKYECPYRNCITLNNRQFFDGSFSEAYTVTFDAIVFEGNDISKLRDFPKQRSSHQKYIFSCTDSSDNVPVCTSWFENFFNWTATYKLDSDIVLPYFKIQDKKGKIIGPRKNMRWRHYMRPYGKDISKGKQTAVAWFVSNCRNRSERSELTVHLQQALLSYGLEVHSYGDCGLYECNNHLRHRCNNLLSEKYFFYLASENSISEDFISEKILTAMQNNVVPIVFGGANYEDFLPPGSYIDATRMNTTVLAAMITKAVENKNVYADYFRWRNYYSYHDTVRDNECAICAVLNNDMLVSRRSEHPHFRKWWHPNYKSRCAKDQEATRKPYRRKFKKNKTKQPAKSTTKRVTSTKRPATYF